MAYDPNLQVPFGYGTDLIALDDLADWLSEHHHPEYVRRLINWLSAQGGLVGVGGGWRDDGSQPDDPGFAPEGQSFHQNQEYDDGFVGACAVDLVVVNPGAVHRAPYWSEVPAQGSKDAAAYGVHANVSTESWHMQPVEIDGWSSWNDNGCPCPVPDYPIAGWEEDDDMTDDDITKIARAVWDYALATGTAGTVLGSTLKQTDDIAGQVWAEPVDDITSGNPLKARDMLRYTRSDSNKTLNRVSD